MSVEELELLEKYIAFKQKRGIGMVMMPDMENYFSLWLSFFQGIIFLFIAIILPIWWLIVMILPYGFSCLLTGWRLKKGYRYFYFLPRFVKEITKPLRNRKGKTDEKED